MTQANVHILAYPGIRLPKLTSTDAVRVLQPSEVVLARGDRLP
jgi:hypothetical protein